MDKETRDILRSIRAGIWTLVVVVAVLGIVLLVRQNGTLGEFVLFILGIGVFVLVVLAIAHFASSVILRALHRRRRPGEGQNEDSRGAD